MAREFRQHDWNAEVEDDCRQVVRLAVREDLDRGLDWTTVSLVPAEASGKAIVATREPGIVAGLAAAACALDEMSTSLKWETNVDDGQRVEEGERVAMVSGSVRELLTAERVVLNLIGRLSGIATLTSQYVEAISGTNARVYDTRKTTPAWRRLEKYAVRCGGGHNHRTGLFDAVLIKDNHLAFGGQTQRFTPAEAVRKSRDVLREQLNDAQREHAIIEIEVDSLDQLRDVLPVEPDIVLLDNMSFDDLPAAVTLRDEISPEVQLEASGGVTLTTIANIASSGVDRISVGALTHSATSLDVGLDWQ
ncbi:MAG: carboxylating nicotinate-nucleotide diphosphorylase [Pirellulales bacterium]|nr:carboxylating nicotinate-nucleotide diphosphorylase [Pirellulales bacterium]